MSTPGEQADATVGLSGKRLDAAVARGILSREQADRLAEFWVRQERLEDSDAPVSRVDAEEVRFVRGFHDVFIAIGIVIFLFGLTYGLQDLGSMGVIAGIAAGSVWILSEIFARRMRLALPSFLLSLAFTPLFLMTCIGLIAGGDSISVFEGARSGGSIDPDGAYLLILPTLIAIAGAVLHYLRFKVPVGVTGIAGGVLLLVAVLIESAAPGFVVDHVTWFMLVAGLVCFALAMMFDSRDIERVTVNSDKAFWLHLMAAPLIVHSALMLVMAEGESQSTFYALVVIGLFLGLAFVAILVDRRALLVSGLGYFGFAIATLMTKAEVSEDITLAMTLVLLGCFILLLGSAWRAVRRLVVKPLSDTAVMSFVPAID
ncbi:hypothetical protein [Labrenzia sp. CE80]|uniref:hypothetical protein n=1 Tax=Labrenzia sp. CE80 TaxID=1788986 RepID=UPI00129B3132|nr:hypothetical protein [Labrenzia sp. CE80]